MTSFFSDNPIIYSTDVTRATYTLAAAAYTSRAGLLNCNAEHDSHVDRCSFMRLYRNRRNYAILKLIKKMIK